MNNKNKTTTNTNSNLGNNQIVNGKSNSNNSSNINANFHNKLNHVSNNNQTSHSNQNNNISNNVKEIEMANDNLETKNDGSIINCKEFCITEDDLTSIIKKGQTKQILNNLANKMLEDLRGLSSGVYETIENLSVKFNDNTTNLLKSASEYKKKIDNYITDPTERNKNIELLKFLRDKIANKQS